MDIKQILAALSVTAFVGAFVVNKMKPKTGTAQLDPFNLTPYTIGQESGNVIDPQNDDLVHVPTLLHDKGIAVQDFYDVNFEGKEIQLLRTGTKVFLPYSLKV